MKYYCNPINVPYRYQFNADPRSTGIQVDREAADPSMICFKGKLLYFCIHEFECLGIGGFGKLGKPQATGKSSII